MIMIMIMIIIIMIIMIMIIIITKYLTSQRNRLTEPKDNFTEQDPLRNLDAKIAPEAQPYQNLIIQTFTGEKGSDTAAAREANQMQSAESLPRDDSAASEFRRHRHPTNPQLASDDDRNLEAKIAPEAQPYQNLILQTLHREKGSDTAKDADQMKSSQSLPRDDSAASEFRRHRHPTNPQLASDDERNVKSVDNSQRPTAPPLPPDDRPTALENPQRNLSSTSLPRDDITGALEHHYHNTTAPSLSRNVLTASVERLYHEASVPPIMPDDGTAVIVDSSPHPAAPPLPPDDRPNSPEDPSLPSDDSVTELEHHYHNSHLPPAPISYENQKIMEVTVMMRRAASSEDLEPDYAVTMNF